MKKGNERIIKALAIAGILGLTGIAGMTALAGNNRAEGSEKQSAKSAYENGWERAEKQREYVYCVGSVSKVYVTAAVMQLVDEGKVSLDEPITEYLPEFRLADERYEKITVRMLMDHTSGIMGTTQLGAFLYGQVSPVHHDKLLTILSQQRLKAEPGEYAAYCNDGFSLLEHIVENVTGKTFTQYVKEKIAAPVGATATGTGNELLEISDLAPAFSVSNAQYENDGVMSLGAGGVYATASDTARFGSAFFTGNDVLLSGWAKKEMARRWDLTDEFKDENGLGWDAVSFSKYEKAGVTGLGKGGDVNGNHAFLLVAPDEKISICVLSNGGSSTLNALLSEAIMDVCLEEKGITFADNKSISYEIEEDIPDAYDAYAGEYVTRNDLAGGDVISRISFPEHKYMHVENIGAFRTYYADYALTKDGRFAELAAEVSDSGLEDIKIAMNPELISFVMTKDGETLIASERTDVFPGLGDYERKSYVGERLPENNVSEDAIASWHALQAQDFVLINDVWSSQNYDAAFTNVVLSDDVPGYLYLVNKMGTRLLRIKDECKAVSVTSVPSSTSRDLIDVMIKRDGQGISLVTSTGLEYLAESEVPAFDGSTRDISLKTGEAGWFSISDGMVNKEATIISRPENSAVYVYNKYGEVIHTTHIVDETAVLPMPKGGKIVFLGETGGVIKLQ